MVFKNFLTYSLIALMLVSVSGCESDEDKELKQEVKAINTHLEEQKNAALERERKRKARYEQLQKQTEQLRVELEKNRVELEKEMNNSNER